VNIVVWHVELRRSGFSVIVNTNEKTVASDISDEKFC